MLSRNRLYVIILLLLYSAITPGLAFCQSYKGRVICGTSNSPVGYVNVGIVGKNIGTVTDQYGKFSIYLDPIYDNDSLLFSMIGYVSKSILVSKFREISNQDVILSPRVYDLGEVKISYHKTRRIRLGVPVLTNDLRSGFADNELGSELGIRVKTKGLVELDNINLNVATCTYDSVTYRLNIYRITGEDQTEYKNILTEPIYLTFSNDKIDKVITLDLRKYSILINGAFLITLELYKDLGEGRLLLHTQFFTGTTYHRKTSMGKWTAAPGLIGMYLYGQLITKTF